MAHAQQPNDEDRRAPALAHLWGISNDIDGAFFTPTPNDSRGVVLPWTFEGVTYKVTKKSSSAHARPPSITYYLHLGALTPHFDQLIVYVLNPKDDDIQANRTAFKHCLRDLARFLQNSMSECDAGDV